MLYGMQQRMPLGSLCNENIKEQIVRIVNSFYIDIINSRFAQQIILLNIYPQFFKGTEGPNQYGDEP